MSERRNYIVVTDFDEESLIRFVDDFICLESDPQIQVIVVYITSYGGEVYGLLAMRDLIKSSPKIVSTIALGKAMSSGAFLLAAGTKGCRFASENSDIMVHELSAKSDGKASDMIQQAMDIDGLNKKLFKNFSDDIDMNVDDIYEEINSRKNADWIMNAQEAKRFGIVDHIGLPRVGQSQSINMLLIDPKLDPNKPANQVKAKRRTKAKKA